MSKIELKVEKWLSIAERILRLLKPKFHNAITKTVVLFGLALSVESQVNILEALSVAIFEHVFGPSDFLRKLFSGYSSPWIGVFFVVFGLIYNGMVTVGLELIEKYKAAIPKTPALLLTATNADGEKLDKETSLRGKRCVVPDQSEIPDNNSYSDFAQKKMEKAFSPIGRVKGAGSVVMGRAISPFDDQINKDFFRERATFLKIWGGAEIISFHIFNKGECLCKNIEVVIEFPKRKDISEDNQNNLNPKLPDQETKSSLAWESPYIPNLPPPKYDIKSAHTDEQYVFVWNLGNLQAKASTSSKTKIFFRAKEDTDVRIKIFCDELTNPIELCYFVKPAPDEMKVSLNLLKSNPKEFFNLVNSAVMDGYFKRHFDRKFEEMNRRKNELIPK